MSAMIRLGRALLTGGVAALALGLLEPAVWAQGNGGSSSKEDLAKLAKGNGDQPEPYPGYRIGPEDILHIHVWNNEALSGVIPVRPDGMISMPLLDDVHAAGLTPLELRDLLAGMLDTYMSQPEVSVVVTDVRSYKVSVIGEVMKPGRYELKSWSTVLDVLAIAGGFTEFADRSGIVVLRGEGTTAKRIRFNYDKVVSERGEQKNVTLYPGDTVIVP